MTSLETPPAAVPEVKEVASQLEAASLQETNENQAPLQQVQQEQPEAAPAPAAKPRRASESGIPPARAAQRRSSTSGTPDVKGLKSPQTTPRIIPRETRSSQLRKSMSGAESGSLLRSAGSLTKEGTPGAAGFELTRLRDELRAEQRERERLAEEVATQKHVLAAKDRALAKAAADMEGLTARLLQAEGGLTGKARELREAETAAQRLRSERQDLERQADRLNRKLQAQPQGTGFSEAVAELEAQLLELRRENGRLADETKAAAGALRAKDKALDRMGAEVEAARGLVAQNGELENYVRDLRRQLAEAGEERATLLQVQRQRREDYARLEEAHAAQKEELARAGRELLATRDQLKAAEAEGARLARELELRGAELARVGSVASRAAHREAAALKEDGTVPFSQHKQEVTHLRGEIGRLREKLGLADKSAAATQLQIRHLYRRIDSLEGRAKVSPRTGGRPSSSGSGPASPPPAATEAAA